jgi:hypothetical protein
MAAVCLARFIAPVFGVIRENKSLLNAYWRSRRVLRHKSHTKSFLEIQGSRDIDGLDQVT